MRVDIIPLWLEKQIIILKDYQKQQTVQTQTHEPVKNTTSFSSASSAPAMVQCEVSWVTGGWPAAGHNIASDAARDNRRCRWSYEDGGGVQQNMATLCWTIILHNICDNIDLCLMRYDLLLSTLSTFIHKYDLNKMIRLQHLLTVTVQHCFQFSSFPAKSNKNIAKILELMHLKNQIIPSLSFLDLYFCSVEASDSPHYLMHYHACHRVWYWF